jgi:colanic acid/amylovoran biosynthesis glycosyltransferase
MTRGIAGAPTVAHFVFPYLPATCSWIHGQLTSLRKFRAVVITDSVVNAQAFPFSPVLAYESLGVVGRSLLGLRYRRLHGVREAFFEEGLRRMDAKLVHCHFGPCGAELAALRARVGIPLVTTFYGADLSQVANDPHWAALYQELFSAGDLFLAEGPAMVRALIQLGCPAQKVKLQRLGVDLATIPFRERRKDSGADVRVLIAGTFREKKGIPDALRAVSEVAKRQGGIRATLIGDGAGKSGDDEEKRRILEILSGLGAIVTWRGFVSHPEFRSALYSHDLFLSPSRTARDGDTEGGAPVSIIEAQAAGMPVIATTHADIPDIVLDGRSGLLSPEGDVGRLAEHLGRLAGRSDLWPAMGNAGREHVEGHHDLRKQGARLEEHYDSLVGNAPPRGSDGGAPVRARLSRAGRQR